VTVSFRPRKRSFAASVEFPRWVVSASVLIIGFVFWLGAVSDSTGKPLKLGVGSLLYFAAVLGTAALSLYAKPPRTSRRAPYNHRMRYRSRSGNRAA
jgi:hypothetical protein